MAKKSRNRNRPLSRKENTREEKKSTKDRELLNFSFKDIDETQPKKNPQTIELWQEQGLLEDLMIRLKELSKLTRNDACKQEQIKIYGDFPPQSQTDFFHPQHVDPNVTWGVIKAIGGQKGIVAGYIVENTFYIVFLDRNHRFWISNKKHT